MIEKIFGLDLDNTIIDYSQSIKVYSSQNLHHTYSNIVEIRNALKSEESNHQWQLAQSWIYTQGLSYAKLSAGAVQLLTNLNESDISTYIVSHKTRRSPIEYGNLDLQTPAIKWINQNLVTIGIKIDSVFFEPSKQEKILRITRLGITHFIDDLIEVFNEEAFPKHIKKYLYSPYRSQRLENSDIKVIKTLDEI